MKKIVYFKGEIIGNNNIIFIEEIDPYITKQGLKFRKAYFKCFCGKVFIGIIAKIKSGQRVGCGCNYTKGNYKHGMSRTSIYNRWRSIRNRCNNPNFHKYYLYGGRGIRLFEDWVNDFKSFYNYVSELSGYGELGLTLDRIDNEGNYEPGNLRWGTSSEQNKNKRRYKTFNI